MQVKLAWALSPSRIDKMDVEAGLPLPNLTEPSSLMDEAHLRAVSPWVSLQPGSEVVSSLL